MNQIELNFLHEALNTKVNALLENIVANDTIVKKAKENETKQPKTTKKENN